MIDAIVCAADVVDSMGVDTAYGRIDGDSAIAVAVGSAFDVHGIRGSVDVRYRYLHSTGIFATYEEGFGAGSEPLRLFLGGLELRPLFLARFLQGAELGKPRLDLLIDSLALELGAFAAEPMNGRFGDVAGLSFALGAELPLFPNAAGPFIAFRAGFRWSREALSGADPSTVDIRAVVFTIAFGWQAIFGTRVIDLGDPRPK